MNPFGSVWSVVGGLVFNHGATQSLVYVAPSLYAGFSWTDTTGMLLAAEVPRSTGYVKFLSMNLLAAVPMAIGATNAIYFCDEFWTNPAIYSGFRVRLAGGSANHGTFAGAFHANANNAVTGTAASVSSPLCFFTEDPVISQY